MALPGHFGQFSEFYVEHTRNELLAMKILSLQWFKKKKDKFVAVNLCVYKIMQFPSMETQSYVQLRVRQGEDAWLHRGLMAACAIITGCITHQSQDNVTHQNTAATSGEPRLFLSEFWMYRKRHNPRLQTVRGSTFKLNFPTAPFAGFCISLIEELSWDCQMSYEAGIICSYFSAWIWAFPVLCQWKEMEEYIIVWVS